MKTILSIGILALTLMGCQSDTYYKAQSVNNRRFGGWQKENADYLTKANDLTLTLECLVTLGADETLMKKTFLLSNAMKSEIEELKKEILIESMKRRVKLASVMSNENDQFCQLIRNTTADNFDFVWTNAFNTKVKELMTLSGNFEQHGNSENLQEFAKTTQFELHSWKIKVDNSLVTE